MLRGIVIGIGLLLLAVAALLILLGGPGGAIFPTLFLGLALTLGVIFERVRYKPLDQPPAGPGWVETGERFVDPASGRLVSVFYRHETGERRYVGLTPPRD